VPDAVAEAKFDAVVELPEPEVWPWALVVLPGVLVVWPFADVEADTVTLNVSTRMDCIFKVLLEQECGDVLGMGWFSGLG
jgi:hypothetical protein